MGGTSRGPEVVTFLMTDVESSTLMWRSAPEAMRLAQARHDDLVTEWAARSDGVRPLQQGEGDSTVIVFADPLDALECALGLQQALHAEPWPEGARIRVRMALTTGAAELRDANYFGESIIRCARIRNAGHGGQILLPLEDHDALVGRAAAGVSFEDLGLHRLKDLDAPERVFQVVHPALDRHFPTLRSLDTVPHNLPVELTSFIGRTRETDDVCDAIARARLVTLTGIGGIGKTRLALQAGARLARTTPDGVWWTDLRAVADAEDIASAIASSLGVREQPGRTVLETVTEHLRRRHAILLLDNCEHVLDGCAHIAGVLLTTCRALRVVATSRTSLGVAGAFEYRVDPLPVPGDGATVQTSDAMHLFAERARVADPRIALDEPIVVSICRRLDGIPLAIELAAARAGVLSLDRIEQRLSDRFALLGGAQRQGTLEAVLTWSYELLSAEQRTVLARASVFAGSFTLEAAEFVCESTETLGALTVLFGTSLLEVVRAVGDVRYQMLETIRDYAHRRLEEPVVVRARHARWFIDEAGSLAEKLRGSDQSVLLDRLEADHDNFRVAMEWSIEREPKAEGALRIAGGLWRFWVWRGHQSQGRAWLERALERSRDAPLGVIAKAWRAAGVLAAENGDLSIAHDRFVDALGAARDAGDGAVEAGVLNDLGVVAMRQGKHEDARVLYEQSLVLQRASGNAVGISRALGNLGVVLGRLGDNTAARALLEESLEMDRAGGSEVAMAGALACLGEIALADNDITRARDRFDEALRLHVALGAREYLPSCLEGVARVRLEQGDGVAAARLLGAAEALRRRMQAPLAPFARAEHERLAGRIAKHIGPDGFDAERVRGENAPPHESIGVARGERAKKGEEQ